MDYLDTVRTFVKVAEANGFTRAADRLGTTTPAVTRHVAALEKHLGARLFRRSTRRITLTESGQIFLIRALQFLREIEEAENLVSLRQGQPSGILRIALPVSFGLCYLSHILKNFSSMFPLVDPHVILSDEPIRLVEQGFDVAIVPDDDTSSLTIVKRQFGSSSMNLVASQAYLAQHAPPDTIGELKQHVLLLEPGKWANDVRRLFEHSGDVIVASKREVIVNNLHMIRQLAMDGHGIAALPDFLVGSDIGEGTLVNVMPGVKLPTMNMCLAFETRQNLPMKVRAFVDFMVENCRQYRLDTLTGTNVPATFGRIVRSQRDQEWNEPLQINQ